jgi:hypothetical protein
MLDSNPEHRDYLTVHNQFHFKLVTLNYITYRNILLCGKQVNRNLSLQQLLFTMLTKAITLGYISEESLTNNPLSGNNNRPSTLVEIYG